MLWLCMAKKGNNLYNAFEKKGGYLESGFSMYRLRLHLLYWREETPEIPASEMKKKAAKIQFLIFFKDLRFCWVFLLF